MEVDQKDLLAQLGGLYLRNQLLAAQNAAMAVTQRRLEARIAELEDQQPSADALPPLEVPTE